MFDAGKTRMIGLPYGEKKTVRICYAVFIWYRNVTDRQTDRFAISISRVSVLTHDKNRQILIKFGTLQQILNSMTVSCWIFYKFTMPATAILKIAFVAITHRPIVRFQRNFVRGSSTACRQRPRDKSCKFFKIQHGRRLPFWKLLNRGLISQWTRT